MADAANDKLIAFVEKLPAFPKSVQRALSVQLQYRFFPIREAQLNARIEYFTIKPGEPARIGNAKIAPIVLSHPVLNFGYRIDCELFFTHHEPTRSDAELDAV